jgi:alkylation response protein AidB-like acyl-CoA dehydrogenase
MNFEFDDTQVMLRSTVREFLTRESPITAVRGLLADPRGYDPSVWRQLADLGLVGLTVPEEHGGQGLGPVELALVLEEMGRAVYPSPYFATVVLAATAIQAGGSPEQQARYLPGLASGERLATLALLEDGLAWDAAGVQTVARRSGSRFGLTGHKQLVPFAEAADLILVPARTSDNPDPRRGITLFAVPRDAAGLSVRPQATMDLTDRPAEVGLSEVAVTSEQVIGAVDGGWPILETVLQHAAVGAAAEMLGLMRQSLAMSVEYARQRIQFGQPIGSFQAIKHKCAEMLLACEQAHAATYYAAWALAAGAADAALAASVAKSYVSEAARSVCGEAIQVHGGIGFTWEYDLHFFFKRAKRLEALYGDADFHRERALALTEAARKPVAVAS